MPSPDPAAAALAARPRLPLRTALILWLCASAVYSAFAWDRLLGPSTDPHFLLQAEAFLHGSLELVRRPPHRNDWASYQAVTLRDGRTLRGVFRTPRAGGQVRRLRSLDGRTLLVDPVDVLRQRRHTFVSFPSGPAVLLLPFVAVFGTDFSDVAFTVGVAGLDAALLFLLLELLVRRGYSRRSRRENVGLTLAFAFATVQLWCAVLGQVWFTALIVGVGCSLLYLLAALDARHPWLAGIALGFGMATRTPLAFAAPFFLVQLAPPGPRWWALDRARLRKLAAFAVPILVFGGALMALNIARFERPFEFGHTYLAGGSIERIKYHGLFGLRFLPTNLAAALVLLPAIHATAPYLRFSRHGMSLLLSSPFFLYLLDPLRRLVLRWRGRQQVDAGPRTPATTGSPAPALRRLRLAAALACACVALPLVLYQNTGHIQYGYRFSLDFTPLLFVLLATGRHRLGRLFWAAVAVGVLVNSFGAVTFKRFEHLYDDHFTGVAR